MSRTDNVTHADTARAYMLVADLGAYIPGLAGRSMSRTACYDLARKMPPNCRVRLGRRLLLRRDRVLAWLEFEYAPGEGTSP